MWIHSFFYIPFKTVNHHLRCLLVQDRKSTRLNSSHVAISYAVFCLKKKRLFDVENFGPYIVESDLEGNSLFAQHAEDINDGIEKRNAGLKQPSHHTYSDNDDHKNEN